MTVQTRRPKRMPLPKKKRFYSAAAAFMLKIETFHKPPKKAEKNFPIDL
jgi:hypothetical protein